MISTVNSKFSKYFSRQTILIGILAFWLSSSLLLDLIIMPTFYASGMMTTPDFATVGYAIFWVFNRLELLCAALILTGVLVLVNESQTNKVNLKVVLAALMLAIALFYTYGLAPQMSTLGLQLNLFSPASDVPTFMNQLHGGYWLLEVLKLCAGGVLLKLCMNRLGNRIAELMR
jgi:hypothetical protein